MSPLIIAGEALQQLAGGLQLIAKHATTVGLVVVIALLLIRFLVDRFNLNPFGRFVYYARRPTNKWFYEIKRSPFYSQTKRALGFDPVWLMALLAFVMFFFLLRGLVNDATSFLACLGITLADFGRGAFSSGILALIGTALLGVIYFVMALMIILVVHSWFGLFDRASDWAGQRVYPILRSLDKTGQYGPVIFIIAFFLLDILAKVVLQSFF